MADNAFLNRAYDYFLGIGYPPHSAAALAANAQHESGGNTQAVHDKGTGIGIFGFRDPQPGVGRKTNLMNWAKSNGLDPNDEVTQLKFAEHELNTSEKSAGDKLRAAQNYQEATNATLDYLRPLNYSDKDPGSSHGYTNRYNIGASLAGVDPIAVPPVGAMQSVATAATPAMAVKPPPAPAPAADQSGVVAGLLAQQAQQEEQKQAAAFASLQKEGLGLLGKATTPAPRLQMAGGDDVYRPQVQPQGMPDFTQILAQQRLKQRGLV